MLEINEKVYRYIEITTPTNEEKQIIGDLIHYQLRGNKDYINNNYLVSIDDECKVKLWVFNESSTNLQINFTLSSKLISNIRIETMDDIEASNTYKCIVKQLKGIGSVKNLPSMEEFVSKINGTKILEITKDNLIYFNYRDTLRLHLNYNTEV